MSNQTPYVAERCFTRDRQGAEVWVVVVKATFTLRSDGTTALAEEQRPVCLAPEYLGEPGRSSLKYESDLLFPKPATDVLIHAQAHAPQGKPVPQLDVGWRVGERVKTLRVFGERMWSRRFGVASLSAPQLFLRMPICYENAFGGVTPSPDGKAQGAWEERNPVGRGFVVDPQNLAQLRAPNVENPRHLVNSWKDRPAPAGFGPLARDWSPRAELVGTYDRKWEEERQPLVPEDFDERFHLCAPEDQQFSEHLRGGEPVVLLHLMPQETFQFTLPRLWLAFRTFFGRRSVDHRARLHTVILEPDEQRLMMVWGTAVPCQGVEHTLERTVIQEKQYL
ncbi:DUF2169 domain-containing protein [Archangium sp.]|uniref:DUF2169 family type VI secretion system accessory protein n=1 Tax=Archangium sp. TaxID=1872627 RepID=UPI002D2E598C|nr:DUF2169 domain-containing protein [Archangium sp.]HYO53652.1 DUF2169 domain-containing protein [Archangium sp.]